MSKQRGRPALTDGETVRVTITIGSDTLAIVRRWGAGNVSAGVRLMASRMPPPDYRVSTARVPEDLQPISKPTGSRAFVSPIVPVKKKLL